jgi:hypothetical protein
MADFLFEPDEDERRVEFEKQRVQSRLAKLHRLSKQWERADEERLRRRVAELSVIVGHDKEWLAREEAWEKEIQRRKDIILKLHDEDAKLERKLLLARLDKATKTMNADIVKAERTTLAARGVIRGRRKSA